MPKQKCKAVYLGEVPYVRAWEIQRRLHQRVVDGDVPDTLLLLEHPHVYTLGRRGKDSDILADPQELARLGAEVRSVDRGGEATYHGPGQLVGYPIVDLRAWGRGPLRYVRTLEKALVATMADFGIQAETGDRPTGVWVGDAKVGAIGVRISRGVTMHGFALNVDPDLSYFDRIVPCGMPEGQVTSMASLLSRELQVGEVVPALARRFGEAFGLEIGWADAKEAVELTGSAADSRLAYGH